ncbi:hypothetical protein [Methylobacterium segetis]|uniref:hypothetical protein n=1 Tax=Methylobacterium segetis TaxID=2488750 RepID=UPI0014054E06|nr:hypothetical protein [Methylobacterium segetis]
MRRLPRPVEQREVHLQAPVGFELVKVHEAAINSGWFMGAKLKPKQMSSADVQAELDRLEAERVAALAEHLRLVDEREAVLLDGTDEDLRCHDEAMNAAKNRAERAALRRERLLPLLDTAEYEEEQARRTGIYEAARKKRDDAVKAVEEYEEAARALAKIALRITAGNFAVSEANRELPDGREPLAPPEPDNGKPATGVEYADERIQVAIDTRTGKEVNGYNPNDPNIVRKWRSTGRQTIVSLPSPAVPHRSFMHGLCIPSREPGKHHY